MNKKPIPVAVLWLALTPVNSPAQSEPPPAAAVPATAPPVAAQTAPTPDKSPRITIDTPDLSQRSVIEVTFPKEAVSAGQLAKQAPAGFFETEPAIPGELRWSSPNSARFAISAPVPAGLRVRFRLAAGQRYTDGTPIPATDLGAHSARAFTIAAATAAGSRGPRQPVSLVVFNDDAVLEKVSPYFIYISKEGSKVPAKVTAFREEDRPAFSYHIATGRKDLPDGPPGAPAPAKDAPVPRTALVEPLQPLPAGQWSIETLDGLPNAAATATLVKTGTLLSAGDYRTLALERFAASAGDGIPEVTLHFNRALHESLESGGAERWLRIGPAVADLKMTADGHSLTVQGDFRFGTNYTLTIDAGLPAGDGLDSRLAETRTFSFTPPPPDLSMPSWDTAQLAKGERTYRVHSRRIPQVRVRVKSLTGAEAVRALQGYRSVKPERSENERPADTASEGALPYSLIAGRTVLDKTWEFPADRMTSNPIELKWNDLAPAGASGVFFLSAEGAHPDKEGESLVTQSIIQLTDLGLAYKLSPGAAMVYVFSLHTGAPVRDAVLTVHGADVAELGQFRTDASGAASVPRASGALFLTASTGADQFTVPFDRSLPQVSLWSFPVNIDWNPSRDFRRTVLLFTDRSLYRPGETAHLKGIVRRRVDTDIQMPVEQEAELVLTSPDQRELSRRKITFSANGTFDATFAMPKEVTGYYLATLEFPSPENQQERIRNLRAEDEWSAREGDSEEDGDVDVFRCSIRVEEFRRNSFEITLPEIDAPPGAESLDVPVSARYLMGQPLSDAKITAYTDVSSTGFYPDKFRDYLFGDHNGWDPYYWRYYYGGEGEEGEDTIQRHGDHQSHEMMLGKDGRAVVPVLMPAGEFPASRRVTVSVEITDVNQQTLTGMTAVTVHAADVHLGIARTDRLLRTGQKVSLPCLAVDGKGERLTRPQPVTWALEREVWETTQVETASGLTQNRSEKRIEPVGTGELVLAPGKDTPLTFTPDKNGTWIVTLRGNDEAGRETATRTRLSVYGAGEFEWEYEEGARIKLLPEKKLYRPGETARLLVLTPIDGTALVTLERNKVLRSFTASLSSQNPVLEIPLTEGDAPNVYVSVTLVKGARDNLRAVKEPILKLGFAKLVVEETASRLDVAIAPAKDPVRPGVTTAVSGSVKSHGGKPVEGAEVTVWCVDEGVLQVTGYENPDPWATFLPQLPLSVRTGISLSLNLPEDKDRRYYMNKGFTIGGGGDEDGYDASKLRKNFDPLAYWNATVTTNAGGRFECVFQTPDTLTRYRVLALAVHGPRRFGAAVSQLTVNKPLMLEPVVPRFASVGDVLTPKAVVHNTSPHRGIFAVTLEPGGECGFSSPAERDRDSVMRSIELAPGESKALTWDVTFRRFGDAVWRWRAEPVTLGPDVPAAARAELVDFVESRFPVQYPGPLLSATKLTSLTPDKPEADLIAGLAPELVAKPARVLIELSRSRFLEAAPAIDYCLHYPYGCVEQTTSSLIPWFAAKEIKGRSPALKKTAKEIAAAIQGGADRLLSMQTQSGGLSYWPGNTEPILWGSTLGGSALIMAKKNGASVPDDAIDRLCTWLAGQMRGFDITKPDKLQDTVSILNTLALAGKYEPAYASRLHDAREGLHTVTRMWLALAMLEGGGDKEQVRLLLALPPRTGGGDQPWRWLGDECAAALQLRVWCRLDPAALQVNTAFETLLGKRNRHGHWRNTFNNSQSLLAMSDYARLVEGELQPAAVQLSGLNGESVTLNPDQPSRAIDLRPSQAGPLRARLTSGRQAWISLRLTSQPELRPLPQENHGLSVTRSYLSLDAAGNSAPLNDPRAGDLVLVKLDVHVPADVPYVAIDDPLPCSFEAVHEDFASQTAGNVKALEQTANVPWRWWTSDHRELRDDRALFFCNLCYGPHNYQLRYLARVTGVGDCTAPPAKIEAMYEPEKYGLSATERLKTGPRRDGKPETAAR